MISLRHITLFLLPSVAIGNPGFEKEIRPLLEKHCFSCHGPEKQKGDLRLDSLDPDMVHGNAGETWHDALDVINRGEMPPEKEPPLPATERRILVAWLTKELRRAAVARKNTGKQVVMRRLNRSEYQHTMTDLLGLEMNYVESLPSDAQSPEGFKNNGASLGMTALQVENYLRTSRKALDLILVEGDPPERSISQVERAKEAIRGPTRRRYVGKSSERLGRVNFWHGSFKDPPREGQFTMRVKASTDRKPGQPAPILFARYGYFVTGLTLNIMDDAGEIEISSSTPEYYDLPLRSEFLPLPESDVPGSKLNGVITLQNILDDAQPRPKEVTEVIEEKDKKGKVRKKKVKFFPEDPDFPRIIIESVEIIRNDYASWPPPLHRRIIQEGEDVDDPKALRSILGRFLRRAWRRPVQDTELAKWLRHHELMCRESGHPVEALKETLSAVLASSHFLYLTEPSASEERRRLNAHELAARLSYFLWSSLPDETLSILADSGELLAPGVFRREFRRLLADEKADRFAEQFSRQWLDLDGVDRVAINPQYYRNFDNSLKPEMVRETQTFFREILRSNSSALQFLDADFTMLNARLAKHYGLKGPRSQSFERVPLEGTSRPGGLLGHASVHLAGSDGVDSHPIKRAVWIREHLLNDPPNPPPPDVPSLEESIAGFEKLPVREQMEFHRKKEACADCHRSIDPWGIALERFDAIGLPREKTARGRKAVSTTTVLPGNHQVAGLVDLQDHLLTERREQFVRAIVTKLYVYALGRSAMLEDSPLIEELSREFARDGYRLPSLMARIATSEPFLSR